MPSDLLSPGRVAAIIEAQFPELKPVRVSYLGEGCDSTTFEVNGRWVFRFPKRDDVEHQLHLESALLPLLARYVPVSIPQFSYHGKPSAEYPRHFAGYEKLPGILGHQLDPAAVRFGDIAPTMAGFLSSLHSFPLSRVTALHLPDYSNEDLIAEAGAEALGHLHLISQVAPDAPIETWRSYLEETSVGPRQSPAPTLVHDDLAAEHILLDPVTQQVTGVIDWSEVSVGDPARDLSCMWHWGGAEFANAVLANYRGEADAGLLGRARYFAACRGVADIAFGLEADRLEYIGTGLRALHLCLSTGL